MRTSIQKFLLGIALSVPLLAQAAPVTFTFTVSIPLGLGNVTGAGTLVATDNGDGSFLVTDITGVFDGGTITGLLPPFSIGANDNKIYPAGPIYLDNAGVDFSLSGNTDHFYDNGVNLYYVVQDVANVGYTTNGPTFFNPTGFTLQRADPGTPGTVPEPDSLALMFAALGFAGVAAKRRYLLSVLERRRSGMMKEAIRALGLIDARR